jgi:hypothetical protein
VSELQDLGVLTYSHARFLNEKDLPGHGPIKGQEDSSEEF